MNTHEAERIAAAMNALRPDWPVRSLVTLLARSELSRRPRKDVTIALAYVACESNTATPARVLEQGPWWRAAAVESVGTAPRHATKAESCTRCAQVFSESPACCDAPSQRPTRGARRPSVPVLGDGQPTKEI